MLLSRKLINRYVDLDGLTTEEIADKLTNAGLEVEAVERVVDIDNLSVGHVLTCEKMEGSDHLHLCQVDLGDHKLPIVCGADNVRQGQNVIVASEGAVLPGDFKIKETKIFGIESKGMICSLSELGIEEYFPRDKHEGIFVFDDENIELGSNALDVLGLNDEIMDIKQTPNRSDFLSLTSIAYELSALFERELNLPRDNHRLSQKDETDLQVSIETKLCESFTLKKVPSIKLDQSPAWIQESLIASGIKPINNLVDISNLVMLETGQPLHFYDANLLDGSLRIVDDFTGTVTGLDGKEYKLTKGDLVIMDGKKPIGIAGIMGLENSMISEGTQDIVIEVGRFDRVAVRQTASRLGVSTESSIRFAKPMDPLAAKTAMSRSLYLLEKYAGAQSYHKSTQDGKIDYEAVHIDVRTKDINRVLGTSFSDQEILKVFNRLYFKTESINDFYRVHIPSFRQDLKIWQDLSEEVIRILGYDRLPSSLPKMDLTQGHLTGDQNFIRKLEKELLAHGANQAITYTLDKKENTLGELAFGDAVSLLSPLSSDRAYLRTQILPSLLKMMQYNYSRRNRDLLFFEHSRIYTQHDNTTRLAIIGQGYRQSLSWQNHQIPYDFFSMKGIFVDTMERLGIRQERFQFKEIDFDTKVFNPYQSAQIIFQGKNIGCLGMLHPNLSDRYDLKDVVYLEVELESLMTAKKSQVKAVKIANVQNINRDLAFLIDQKIQAENLIKSIKKSSNRTLQDIHLFDVFESQEFSGKRSLAFKLSFDAEKVKTNEEVQNIMDGIEAELINKFSAIIR